MTRQDLDLLLEALAVIKAYQPTHPKQIALKWRTEKKITNRLNRRRTWWQRVRKEY